MEYTTSIRLDVNPKGSPPVIRVKQGDGYARFLAVTLTKDGVTYIPESGVDFYFRCEKPDGKAVVTDSVTTDEELHRKMIIFDSSTGIITVELVEQVTVVSGRCRCDLCLMKNEQILSTIPFVIEAIASPDVGSRLTSTDEFLQLMQALDEVDEDIEKIETAVDEAEEAVEAANAAIANANTATAAANAASERADTATTNANAAAGIANTAAGNATSAATAANTAAATATTAAGNADTATANANTATSNASTAATAANTAAGRAETAVGTANTALENANTALTNANAAKTAADQAAAKVTGITASAEKLAPGANPTATVTGGTVSGETVTPYSIAFGIPGFPGLTVSASSIAHGEEPTADVTGGTTATTPYAIAFGIPAAGTPEPISVYSYQNSDYGTEVPAGEWSSTPSPVKGKYLWIKVVTTWSVDDGTVGTTTDYLVSYIGADGTGAVNSVNSKAGDVVLYARDIETAAGVTLEDALAGMTFKILGTI